MAKTINEQIHDTQEQIRQSENYIKRLTQKYKTEVRKARTRRLIQRGAIVESLIDGAETLTNEQVKAILETALRANSLSPNQHNSSAKSDNL